MGWVASSSKISFAWHCMECLRSAQEGILHWSCICFYTTPCQVGVAVVLCTFPSEMGIVYNPSKLGVVQKVHATSLKWRFYEVHVQPPLKWGFCIGYMQSFLKLGLCTSPYVMGQHGVVCSPSEMGLVHKSYTQPLQKGKLHRSCF